LRSAALRQRLRAGLLDQEKIELLAYCGDRAAQELVECRWCCEHMHAPPMITPALRDCPLCGACLPKANLGDFVHGLLRWGKPVMIRGALAVVELALSALIRERHMLVYLADYQPLLEPIKKYLQNPNLESEQEAIPGNGHPIDPAFVWELRREIYYGDGLPGAYAREACHDACRVEDEHRLGQAARTSLTSWAMEGV